MTYDKKREVLANLSEGFNGAGDENRTRKGLPTRPSNVRVYQFHHPGELRHYTQ